MENNEQIVSIECDENPAHQIFLVTTSSSQMVNRRGEVIKEHGVDQTYTCQICSSTATYAVF